MKNINVPVGISNFEKIRQDGYYYVDKTGLIKDMLKNKIPEVTLITRPRRFGKTLAMSMLASFFDIRRDSKKLFQGLNISKEQQLCNDWMNQYPTLFLSFKDVDGTIFENALGLLQFTIAELCKKHTYLIESDVVDQDDKETFRKLKSMGSNLPELQGSIIMLMNMMKAYYNKQVILLIDEYDVPLAKAYENGYYDEMILLIRNLFGNVLKTNDSLAFAVLTGCLRIAKESIFTGLNNFKVYSITDDEFDETFGFTNKEVMEMLQYYGLSDRFDEVKEWYDGYRFGNADVYCAWDVVNYCRDHCKNPNAELKNYWMNTSGNEIINHFVDSLNQPGMLAKRELERLVNGETVVKRVDEMITYKELYTSIDNLWSTMFMTGYLTQHGKEGDGYYRLAIPNREIRNIIIERILKLFRGEVSQNREMFRNFYTALQNANAPVVEKILTEYMTKTISIRDNFVKTVKENFYHGLLIGILGFADDWSVYSNRESGNGFSDIIIEAGYDDDAFGIVMELKWSDDEKSLDQNCRDALEQIDTRQYTQELRNDGYQKILKYGIAFYRKKCRVMVER